MLINMPDVLLNIIIKHLITDEILTLIEAVIYHNNHLLNYFKVTYVHEYNDNDMSRISLYNNFFTHINIKFNTMNIVTNYYNKLQQYTYSFANITTLICLDSEAYVMNFLPNLKNLKMYVRNINNNTYSHEQTHSMLNGNNLERIIIKAEKFYPKILWSLNNDYIRVLSIPWQENLDLIKKFRKIDNLIIDNYTISQKTIDVSFDHHTIIDNLIIYSYSETNPVRLLRFYNSLCKNDTITINTLIIDQNVIFNLLINNISINVKNIVILHTLCYTISTMYDEEYYDITDISQETNHLHEVTDYNSEIVYYELLPYHFPKLDALTNNASVTVVHVDAFDRYMCSTIKN